MTYRESLRDIEACLRAMSSKLYHMGFRGRVARSTLADANDTHGWRIYADFLQVLIRIALPLYASDPIGVDLDQSLYALDSMTIDLCLSLFPWAKFRQHKAAVKMHTLLDLRGNIPTLSALPTAECTTSTSSTRFCPRLLFTWLGFAADGLAGPMGTGVDVFTMKMPDCRSFQTEHSLPDAGGNRFDDAERGSQAGATHAPKRGGQPSCERHGARPHFRPCRWMQTVKGNLHCLRNVHNSIAILAAGSSTVEAVRGLRIMNIHRMEELIPEVRFTRKEEQLLETLVRHVNQVVSRRYLLRNVWEYSDDARTRTVDVHIRRLRSKLAGRPDLRISTIFGEGYVLESAQAGGVSPNQAASTGRTDSVVRGFQEVRPVGRPISEPANGEGMHLFRH